MPQENETSVNNEVPRKSNTFVCGAETFSRVADAIIYHGPSLHPQLGNHRYMTTSVQGHPILPFVMPKALHV